MAGNFEFNIDANAQGAVNAANQVGDAFGKAINQVNQDLDQLAGKQRTVKLSIEAQGLDKAGKQLAQAREELGVMAKRSEQVKLKQDALGGTFSSNSKKLSDQVKYLNDYRTRMTAIQRPSENVKRTIAGIDRNLKQGNQKLAQMRTGVKGVSQESTGMGEKFAQAGVAANLITQAINSATQSLGQFINTGLQMELLMLQLEGFTGSAEAARETFEEFKKIAVQTPLNVSQVAQAGKILLAFGLNTKDATDALRRLAIIAGATGADVGLLSRNLGQISANGRAFTRDLIQFGNAGIPIFQELSAVTGLFGEDLQKAIEAGSIGFDEVTQALINLTDETSAFAKTAERMNRTFTGVFEELSSEVQDFSGTLVIGFNEFDEAIGGVVKGSFKLLASSLRSINKNSTQLKDVLVPLTGALVALGVATGVVLLLNGTLAAGLGLLAIKFGTLAAQIGLAAAAKAAWVVLTNPAGLALVASAAIAAGIAWGAYKSRVEEANVKVQAHGAKIKQMTGESYLEWAKFNDEIIAGGENLDEWAGALAEATKKAVKAKQDLQQEQKENIDQLREYQEKGNEVYDAEKQEIQDVIDKHQENKDKLKESRDQQIEDANRAYDNEKQRLDEQYDAIIRNRDEQIDALRQRGPEEQKLYDLRKKQLQADINSGKLKGIELQRAKAQLERMERQEQISKLQLKNDADRKEKADQMRQAEEKKDEAIKSANDKYDNQASKIDKLLTEQETKLGKIEDAQDEFNKKVDDAVDKFAQGLKPSIEGVETAIGLTVTRMQDLQTDIDLATTKANNLANALADAIGKQKQLEGGNPKRFAGGPVTGGKNYTVNELGQEAFLSASGNLSMIDAPSWGTWKAPGAGTVIPAHITAGLNIPSGGVQSRRSASGAASSAGSSNGMMRALRGLTGGSSDRITNNVTIQAANTVQAASDMMVQLNKIRRRRLG